jgi:hypothetical protein
VVTKLLDPPCDFNKLVLERFQLSPIVGRINPFLGGDGRFVAHMTVGNTIYSYNIAA